MAQQDERMVKKMRNMLYALALVCGVGCTFSVATYPLSPFIIPTLGLSTNSISTPGYGDFVDEEVLKGLTIGVLRNPYRSRWQSAVDGEFADKRTDENELLAAYLKDTDLFGDVVLVDGKDATGADYVISCSVDCIYTIELNEAVYIANCVTLGVGFLLGVPHQESSAFYVAEAVVMEGKTGEVVSGSLAENYKTWRYDNMYWRPNFYSPGTLSPLFEQILYDFLTRSGCLQRIDSREL